MRLSVIILSVLIHYVSASQPIIPRFETLGVNEGLSQNSVYAIYQDKEGFMWFGTADGLNRYDGEEIKIYKTQTDLSKNGNSNFIRGNLCEDKNGNIWFSTETGVYYYDRLEGHVKQGYLFDNSSYGIIYYYLVSIDSEQTLWLQNPSLGIVSFQTKTKKWIGYPIPLTAHNFKLSIRTFVTIDHENNIWCNWYNENGMLKFNTKERRYEHFFAGKNYSTIFFTKGKHFITTPQFIYRYDSLSSITDSFKLNIPINNLPLAVFNCMDSYGRLWSYMSNDGLKYLDFNGGKIYQYQRNISGQQLLSSNLIRALLEDRSGNLWIGTDGGGVCKLDLKPPFFNIFPINKEGYSGLRDFFIKSIYEDADKGIWFGTLDGLHKYDPAEGTVKSYFRKGKSNSEQPGNVVSSIFRDRDHNLWIGHSKGISIFDENLNTSINVVLPQSELWANQSQSTLITKIFQLQNGEIVVTTNGPLLLLKKDRKNTRSHQYLVRVATPIAATDVLQAKDGDIWFTTPVSGVYHCSFMDDSLVIKENFFSGNDHRSIHIDELNQDILWISSSKGLIRFDTKTRKYQLYNESNGMLNSYVYGILEDGSHNFWMSTNGGLTYFNRQKGTFQNYTVNEGLQSNEFNTGAFHKGASGNFYFGGVNGFNWFRPGIFNESKTKPGVGITSILIQNTPFFRDSMFRLNKTINLNYSQNDLVIQVAALDYTRPQANKIQYRLIGWNDKWVTTYNKQIRYGKLLPGDYTLIIKASNNTGEWSDEEKIRIIISAPFWQRTWFYVLCGSILMIAVILVTRSLAQRKIKEKLRHLEKQQAVEAERNRISKDMHDEIGSGLTRIALMTELMNTHKQLDDKTKQGVEEIAGSTRQLVESMSEIIWTLNPHNDKLDNLLAYLREQTQRYFEPLNVNYKVSFPEIVPDITLSNEQRRNLFLVSKEALNNALKHSSATSIELNAEIADKKLKFSIIDNGKGLDGALRRNGSNGLKNMQHRINDIKGEIEWVSSKGGGTRVSYWINI